MEADQTVVVVLGIVQQQVGRAPHLAAARLEFFQLLANLREVHAQDAGDLALSAQLVIVVLESLPAYLLRSIQLRGSI